MKNSLIALLVFMFYTHVSNGQIASDTIPFTLNKQSNICIKAQINGSDTLILMFHTAASGITIIKEAVEKKLPLKLDKSSNVSSWGGTTSAPYSEDNTMTISHQKWDSMIITQNENSGAGTDGKFGYDLFLNKIVEIDYDKNIMIVHEKMPNMSLRGKKGYTKNKLIFKRGSMHIEGAMTIGKEVYKDSFMFHTGYGGAILLDPKIAEKYNMAAQLKTLSTSELRDSYNNIIKIETKLLPRIKIAGQKLKDIPLSFAAQSSQIPMKVFGNDLLKRFNIIFDFQNNDIYMKPNGLWDMAYTVKK
jgi:predicted aspartyl protease